MFHSVKKAINNIRILGPEAFWVFIGQIGTAIAGLLGVKVLTNILGPGEFGRLTLANTLVALISTNFLFGPLGQGLIRFWPFYQARGELGAFYCIADRYGRYTVGLSVIVAILLLAVVMIIKGGDWAFLLAVSMAAGIASGWLGLRISIFTAARQRQRVSLFSIGNGFLNPIIATGLILLVAANALWAMAGYLLAILVTVLIAERYYDQIVCEAASSALTKKNMEENIISGITKNILAFSWPFAVWGIFNWAHISCDRWSLQTFHGAEVVGAFAVVSQLATFPLAFGSGFLSTLFAPIAFQKAGDIANRQNLYSANKILGVMTGVYILGAVILVLLFSIFHYPLVLLISNIQFAQFSVLLPWLTVAWALFYLGQTLSIFGLLANRPQSYIMPKLVSSIVAVVGTFYLASEIGPSGIVWGLGAAGGVYIIWCAVIAWEIVLKSIYREDLKK